MLMLLPAAFIWLGVAVLQGAVEQRARRGAGPAREPGTRIATATVTAARTATWSTQDSRAAAA